MALRRTTAAAATESAKLQRHFGRFDILFFLICTIVGVDTIASVSSGGEAFTWMIILALSFFVPAGAAVRRARLGVPAGGRPVLLDQAGLRPPGRGGQQLPLLDHQPGLDRRHPGGRLRRRDPGLLQPRQQPVHAAVLRGHDDLRLVIGAGGHHVLQQGQVAAHQAGAFARFLLLGLFTISCIIYAAKHGVHGLGGSYKPSYAGFVALVGVLLFNYVGFELPSSAGEEMTNPKRDVPFAIARSAVGSVLLYALPVLGILIVLPSSAVTNFGGFVDAIKACSRSTAAASPARPRSPARARALGDTCAILFILCLLTSGVTWIMGSDRALAVSGYDGAGPRSLGVINARYGMSTINLSNSWVQIARKTGYGCDRTRRGAPPAFCRPELLASDRLGYCF